MSRNARAATFGALLLLIAVVVAVLAWPANPDLAPSIAPGAGAAADPADPNAAVLPAAAGDSGAAAAPADRQGIDLVGPPTGVRGVVVDARTGQPLAGIEVVAVKDEPSIEPLVARFRGFFQEGMFVETRAPRRELGRTTSNADGSFELLGLAEGRVFLDGRSDGWFVRTPGTARLARGQIAAGIELRASPGGRVRGVVLGADGAPAKGASVSVRPGLNAFFGQITERQYRWLEAVTDDNGVFDLPGVPAGTGYTVAASGEHIALEEVTGVDVRAGAVTEVTVRGHQGALVAGRVLDPQGQPVAGANVAMVYLDISRVLFSADGRAAPIATDAEGRFRIEHVAAGRVAVIAAATDLAPSGIEELAVVDGGVYDDLALQLGVGATLAGRVVDDQQQPVAGALVELRPFERGDDPQFLKVMLKVRRVEVKTDAEGRFVAKGLTGDSLIVQAQKPGYTTAVRWGVKLAEKDLVVAVQRGATVRGKVTIGDQPLARFRVDTRTSEIPKPKDGVADDKAAAAGGRDRNGRGVDGNSGASWTGGGRRGGRIDTQQLPEGQTMVDRGMNGMDGNWREVQAADGAFELRGIPPGRVRVRVRADGYLEPANVEVDLQPGQTSDVLAFALALGEPVAGRVVDENGLPVSDAQVTAYKQREGGQRRGGFNFQIDPEDFDFLALSAATNRRSAISDSKGEFAVPALEPGRYRFTARHPDKAKASAKDVEVKAGVPTPPFDITLDDGGGVEGTVTGLGMQPLADALVVAFSLQTGTMRSNPTDKAGFYRIDGLPGGQYVVFKSKLGERADNIPLELMSNMRLKAVTVKPGRFTRLDVHDEGEDGVRVHGVVRENGAPTPRALVSLLGSDREGLLGMGVRAGAAGMDGRYELIGIKPGSYVMQVTRFQGRPVQTTFEVEVPDDARDFVFDVALPTSQIAGRVVDTRGQPVADVQVTLGSSQGALAGADGLIGLIAQNGLAQARTDKDGAFTLRSVAAGTYRVTAGAQLGGRRRGGGDGEGRKHGEATVDDLVVDGARSLDGIVVVVPLAGRITGVVLDGSGAPVAGAEIVHAETSAKKKKRSAGNPLLDLVGAQARPVRTGDDGRFVVDGLNPGTYSLKVETEAVETGKLDDVGVGEDATVDVTLRIVRGATLKLRATNVDKKQIPFAQISLFDGKGKPVVSRVSTLTVMKRLMTSRDEVKDSGWYEFGSVPPDTYTLVVTEPGQPELRIVKTIRDGETVAWEFDVAAELAARKADGK
jgi:protocatechuate 3,4-dioxygenase beta subunit